MHRRPRLSPARGRGGGTLLAAPALLLAGCASVVAVEPAPSATDPLCAQVLVAVREGGYAEVAGLPRRETDAQGTAAWGDPPVVLRCGVEPPGPTTDPCLGVNDVDWVLRESGERRVFTTFGRQPAVEVSLPAADGVAPDAVLAALGDLVSGLPQVRECL